MVRHGIETADEKLAEFCRRWHVQKLSFFGSFLRDDFGPNSDIDVLVTFEGERTPGLAIITMEQELSALLGGRRIDLATEDGVNPHIMKRVMSEGRTAYVLQE